MGDAATTASRPNGCPAWCVVPHDPRLGEEDWVHRSAPVLLADAVEAALYTSVDPHTGEQDGPYVLIGTTEHTLDEAASLGVAVTELAALGATR